MLMLMLLLNIPCCFEAAIKLEVEARNAKKR